MKKILIYALVALGMTFTLSSCEKMFGNFLDKEPSNQLTEILPFQYVQPYPQRIRPYPQFMA